MIRFAILGAGKIAAVMADTINAMVDSGNQEIELYAVASRDLTKAKEFADKHRVSVAYGSYEELYADSKVDLVYIATPHNFHYEQAKSCIENGKHVLCEKAFTVNAKDAEKLFELAKKHKVLITEAIWTRYQPMRQIINETVNSGLVGTPMFITANLSYPMMKKQRLLDPNLAGGALLDVGIYTLNFAEMIFGHADTFEGTCIKNALGVDISDSITLTWKDTGRMAVLATSATASSDRYGMIHCTEGYAQVENINNPQWIKLFDKQFKLIKEVSCPKQFTGYEYEVSETCDCIRKGLLECPSMPHQETIHMLQVMDTLRAQFGIKYPFEK